MLSIVITEHITLSITGQFMENSTSTGSLSKWNYEFLIYGHIFAHDMAMEN